MPIDPERGNARLIAEVGHHGQHHDHRLGAAAMHDHTTGLEVDTLATNGKFPIRHLRAARQFGTRLQRMVDHLISGDPLAVLFDHDLSLRLQQVHFSDCERVIRLRGVTRLRECTIS